MPKPREPWDIRPAKKPVKLTASMKADIETTAKDFIEKTLKPKYIQPPKKGEQFNYITDIGVKWYRNNFYVFLVYACPSPNALAPTFETMFARIEPLVGGKFALYAMRYTGKEWIGVLDALSLDECLMAKATAISGHFQRLAGEDDYRGKFLIRVRRGFYKVNPARLSK